MKKLLLLFSIFFFLSFIGGAQNLVPNPSFEDTVSCPSTTGQINNAVEWSSYRVTPDYFNTCANTSSLVSIPWNATGYHYPRTGNAYAGFIIGWFNAREYLGIQLSQVLNIGQQYYGSFYVCRAGSVNYNRASNKIGVHLSTIPYSSSSPEPISNISQVYTDSIITDTVNWTRVSGSFIADSAYQFLSIGNFFNDSLTTYILFDSIHYQSYYYIDDICVSTDSLTCNGTLESIPEQTNTSSLQLFPNPATNQLTVKSEQLKGIKIYDVLGSIVFDSGEINTSSLQINTSAFSPGVYVAVVKTVAGGVEKRKIIIK